MAYTIEVNHPDFPKGHEFDCDGILVKNGSSVKVSAEVEQWFLGHNGRTLKEVYHSGDIVKITGTSEIGKASSGGDQ